MIALLISLSPNFKAPPGGRSIKGKAMASLSPISIVPISSTPKRTSFFDTRNSRFLQNGHKVLRMDNRLLIRSSFRQVLDGQFETERLSSKTQQEVLERVIFNGDSQNDNNELWKFGCSLSCGVTLWLSFAQVAESSEGVRTDMVYEVGELFELGIQLSYLIILLGLLGLGTFFVIRQVLVRRELDLSAKELQEQVRSGDATATECFELGAVMLRRKFYPAAIKYLQQAIERWDKDDQDLAQVYNALGVSYVRDKQLDKGITQFEKAIKLQPGYVTAWNNLGDAYEKRKDLRAALKAFEEVLLFDPNNKIARPRRDVLRDRVQLYKGVPIKSEDR